MIYFFIFLLLAICIASIYGNYHFIKMLWDIEENCQYSLDYLDKKYKSINTLLHDSNLVSDDPIARKFVEEIKDSLNGILFAANVLKDPSKNIDDLINENDEENEKNSESGDN